MVRAYSDYRPNDAGWETAAAPKKPFDPSAPQIYNSKLAPDPGPRPSAAPGGGKKPFDPNWTSHTSTDHFGRPVGGYTGPGISGMPTSAPGIPLPPPVGPQSGPQVTLNNPGNPNTYTSRQTDAAANYSQAQAYRQGDPRAANKAYQRGGLSSSKGTQAAGAADASQAFASNMAAAEQGRMNDAYANANVQLGSDSMRNQFGQALAGLGEDATQMQYMQNMRNMQNATSFMGNLFGTMTRPPGGGGGGNGMLGQLLGGLM